jgi:tetratricopeptide (TPR) repeat protein
MHKKPKSVGINMDNINENRALLLFNAGHYKEAIACYKKLLLLHADNPKWRQQLAECYWQRAMAFGGKGMFKEALELWKEYCQHAQAPDQHYGHYLVWLLQTGNLAKIKLALQQLSVQQIDHDFPELAALLGLLILAGHSDYQEGLAQGSAFLAHLTVVQSALQLSREYRWTDADAALKQLPYRSAFRDFRTLLKGVTTMSAALAETQSIGAKISETSPYQPTARLVLACRQKGSALVRALAELTATQRRVVGDVIGLTKKQLELLEQLSLQKDRLSDKAKFNLVIQYQSLFGADLARQYCYAALAGYPAGRRECEKNFGALDDFEANRLAALIHERNDRVQDADYYWYECIRNLRHAETESAKLQTALILRHLASKQIDEDQIHILIESLDYDPEDRVTHLQILDFYGQSPNHAEIYKQRLNQALAQFPEDAEVLARAIKFALRNQVYAQAVRYAMSLLKTDPLNRFAKQALFFSHLAYVRQLLQQKKYHLAEKEIQQAEALKLGASYALQAQLLSGFLSFAAQDKKQGLQVIAGVLGKLNKAPLNSHFQAAIEALLAGLPVSTVLRELPGLTDYQLSEEDLSRFIALLQHYQQQEVSPDLLFKALDKIKAALKKSLQLQAYDEALMLSLCQIFATLQHFEFLRFIAQTTRRKQPKPIWMYYWIFADTRGQAENCSMTDRLRLELNLEEARLAKDQRVAMLIGDYLDRYFTAHPMKSPDFLETLFDQGTEAEQADPLDELFGHIPDEVMVKVMKKLEALAKKTKPEWLVQEVSKFIHPNTNIFHAIMQNPDVFPALMIVKAANELAINIGVSYADVLDYFGLGKKI